MEIEEFFKIYQNAVWHKDATTLINLYDKQAVIFDLWDEGYIINATEWNKAIQDWLDSLGDEKVKVAFEMIKIHRSGNVGFASGLMMF